MLRFQPHISGYNWINMPQFILCFIWFHFMPFLFGDAITKPLVGLVKFGTFATLNTILTIETFMTFMTFVQWWGDLTWPKKSLRCCDIWDTDYNTDNWEPEFMTIFVIWQLIVTLDSIRNSCDVFGPSPKTAMKMLMIITTIMIMIIIPIMLFITWLSCRRVNNLVPASLQRVSCFVSKNYFWRWQWRWPQYIPMIAKRMI